MFGAEWKKYFRACFPKADVGQNQYNETQQAFYSGGMTAIGIIMREIKTMSRDEAIAFLDRLHVEISFQVKGFIERKGM